MDPSMSSLLKWSVENSAATANDPTAKAPAPASRIDPAAFAALFGGPSDADLMISSMLAIRSTDPEVTIDDKLVAFDNFEQLIENLDNANNLDPLELWPPLIELLGHEEGEIRKYAAWCIGTAVQNNEKSQAKMLAMGGIEPLVRLAVKEDEDALVRRKAVYALSSAGRNYQPGMDAITNELARLGRKDGLKVDASDMDECDLLIGGLRDDAAKARASV